MMRQDTTTAIKQALVLAGMYLPLLLVWGVGNTRANETVVLRKYLESRAEFDAADTSSMERGDVVSKILQSKDKHEIAFCGVVSVNASPEKGFEIFQDRLSRLDKKSLVAFGSFSDTPTLADLLDLTLEAGDIEALKSCSVGNCGLRLSAAMIERFQTEVDWAGPNYAEQAEDLFRRLILEYILDYRARGENALIEYRDKPEPLPLRSEYDILLKELYWVNEFAPEFFKYLQHRAVIEPPNIKRSIGWAKIKFGLKPVVLITEVITYTPDKQDARNDYLLSVSRQIYANRYLDSSIGLIALVRDPGSGPEPSDRSYLLYANHSRSSSLRGILGKFKRKVVQTGVIEKLALLLQKTRTSVEYDRTNHDLPEPAPTILQKIKNWAFERPFLLGSLFFLVAFFTLKRRIGRLKILRL